MSRIFISENVNKELADYLTSAGHTLIFQHSQDVVMPSIAAHPDIFMCKMGVVPSAPIVFASEAEVRELGMKYPADIAFNGACTGKYFIHALDHTNERLLMTAKAMDMQLINVRQGYTKCSTVVVDENSIITYDQGIAKACAGLQVLTITAGHVALAGFDTGFIGGASGRVADEIIFNGDLSAHPDFARILEFIAARKLRATWFKNYPLTDIGSFYELA